MNFFSDEKNIQKIFWGLLGLIFVIMCIVTPHYGISGDDVTQWRYGTSVWNYIKTFGEDKTAVTGKYLENTQTLYGGIVDGVAAMFIDIFKPKDEFLVRHYWVMLFGFTGIMYTGLLAKKLTKSWIAGIIAILFIVFTPRFFGEAFNNPKDIPFAATYIMSLYYIIAWLENINEPKWKYTVLLGIAIMLCLGIRIGGLLLIAYLGLAYLITLWQSKVYKNSAVFRKTIIHGLVVLAIGYFGACIWWPYAWEDPLNHPYEAYKVMSNYPLQLKMLFEGQETFSTSLPQYYAPKFIAMTLPLFAIVGVAGAIVMLISKAFRSTHRFLWLIMFAWAFPVFYIYYTHAAVYDGMRHTLFILPPVAITATLFYHYLIEKFKEKKVVSIAVASVMIILLALPARFTFANHPNEYVYFNEFVGGVKGANGIYETDYYMNSIKQGYNWLNEHEFSKLNTKDTVVLASNCVEPIFQYLYNSKVPLKIVYVRYYEKNTKDWDYGLFYGRFLDREELQNGYFPSKLAIKNIEADGVALCTVIKNDPDRSGFKGREAMKVNDLPAAITYHVAATKKDEYDGELWKNLALLYMATQNMPAAKDAIDHARAISTLDLETAEIAGDIALRTGDINGAQTIYGELLENSPEQGEGYLGMAKIQAGQGNYDMAIQNIQSAVDKSPYLQKQAFMLMAMIMKNKGNMAEAQRFAEMAQGAQQQ